MSKTTLTPGARPLTRTSGIDAEQEVQAKKNPPKAEAQLQLDPSGFQQSDAKMVDVQGGLLNQSSLGLQSGGIVSPMGARMMQVGVSAGQHSETQSLEQLGARFDVAADKLVASKTLSPKLKAEFRELAETLAPMVESGQATVDELATALKIEEPTLNWFQRTFGVFLPDNVAELKDKKADADRSLKDTRAFAAGARIGGRFGQKGAESTSPETWKAKLDEANSAASAATPETVAGLVKAVDALDDVTGAARLQEKSAEQDISSLGEKVAWHQTWGWLDKLIGGESGRGFVYRAGQHQEGKLEDKTKALGELSTRGNHQANSAVSELLKKEDPAYKATRERYDVVAPAHHNLQSATRLARRAKTAIRDARRWISQRDALKMSEPFTKTHMVENPQTKKMEERETPQYTRWKQQYSHARQHAEYEKRSAEDAVSSLNRTIPDLERALADAGKHYANLENVDDDLTNFWSPFGYSGGFNCDTFSHHGLQGGLGGNSFWDNGFGGLPMGFDMGGFGMFSWDGSEVDTMGDQLGTLSGQLSMLNAQIAPEYGQLRDEVNSKVAARRSELLES